MNKLRRNDFLLSFFMMIVIICISVCIVLFTKHIYYLDIHYLNIGEGLNLSVDKIKENYDILINYQSIFYKGDLVLPDFVMSQSGIKHFKEVKVVFEIVQYIALFGGIIGAYITYKKYKQQDSLFFKYTTLTTCFTPLLIGTLAMINFDKAFILFHQIVFRNNDWIFDIYIDPVILILPETFFMHCFILIVVVVILICLIYYYIYHKILKNFQA